MVCGTGVGAAIGANKMKGIRAAVCHDVHSAHQCVEHDDVCALEQLVGERGGERVLALGAGRGESRPELVEQHPAFWPHDPALVERIGPCAPTHREQWCARHGKPVFTWCFARR